MSGFVGVVSEFAAINSALDLKEYGQAKERNEVEAKSHPNKDRSAWLPFQQAIIPVSE
jgi:hypothetical protein